LTEYPRLPAQQPASGLPNRYGVSYVGRRICFWPNVSCAKKTAKEYQMAVENELRMSTHGTIATFVMRTANVAL
ncbi:MAG: hypothetical protein V3R90_08150, partial [Limibaculum sp.]